MCGRIVSGGGFETRLDGPIANRPQVENLPHNAAKPQPKADSRRQEWRRGTQECVRHKIIAGGEETRVQ